MENKENRESFSYSYSAKEREELLKIRAKYSSESAKGTLELLKEKDKRVTRGVTVFAVAFGIVGVIVMGFGMSIIMSDFGTLFGSYAFFAGILSGVLGMCIAILAYPVYKTALRRARKKAAPEILKLSEELLK